ncbi:MAG: nitrilase-related carbon-nitrogen hydrolase, partial [Pseudomonadota bacterium]
FLIPSAWPKVRLDAWILFNRARALENLAYLISCNCAGTNQGTALAGSSMVVSPAGDVLARAGEDEQIISLEIDPQAVDRLRAEFPAVSDRVFK